ncbi:MAG TPA: biotin-dependent carboxyltransferase, partial [Bacilli bacterium]|nr:biotin-dependent carboxyltransferase [Bacilli bacterium]
MSKRTIIVEKGGLLTTIQDLGRFGSQQYGVVVGGVMDSFSSRVANILVGNDEREAVIEMTVIGAELKFLFDATIAVCGGGFIPMIDGKPCSMWKTIYVKEGETLHFKTTGIGVRTYIAVDGGFFAENILGSKSTYLRGGYGGYHGRSLKKGDVIACKQENWRVNRRLSLSPTMIPCYQTNEAIRVILGPDSDFFTSEGIDTFLTNQYTVSNEADRMGYRLQGEPITHSKSANILSDSVTFGTIQVPAEGLPIVMMADRQTTGGYPRIAHVITVDLPRLAQLKHGDDVYFTSVDLEEAQTLYREREFFCKNDRLAN